MLIHRVKQLSLVDLNARILLVDDLGILAQHCTARLIAAKGAESHPTFLFELQSRVVLVADSSA